MTKPAVKAVGPNLIELPCGQLYLLKPGDWVHRNSQNARKLHLGTMFWDDASELLEADLHAAIVDAINWPQPMKLDVRVTVAREEGS